MTTTVTTTTVTTVTVMGFTAGLGVLATVLLIGFLVAKQLAGAAPGERAVQWGKTLNIAIVPLLVAFTVIAAVKLSALV